MAFAFVAGLFLGDFGVCRELTTSVGVGALAAGVAADAEGVGAGGVSAIGLGVGVFWIGVAAETAMGEEAVPDDAAGATAGG